MAVNVAPRDYYLDGDGGSAGAPALEPNAITALRFAIPISLALWTGIIGGAIWIFSL